jgi:hypothetical protein
VNPLPRSHSVGIFPFNQFAHVRDLRGIGTDVLRVMSLVLFKRPLDRFSLKEGNI